MLRITTTHDDSSQAVLKLEGKLLEPWISELVDACLRARGGTGAATLDLSGISFVDLPAAIAVRDLVRRGIAITGCSPLVAELLKENNS